MSDQNPKTTTELSRRAYLTRALVVFLGASYAVLEVTDIFIDQLPMFSADRLTATARP